MLGSSPMVEIDISIFHYKMNSTSNWSQHEGMEEVEGMRVGGVGLGRSKTTTVAPQGSKSAQCMTVVVPVEEAPLETGSAGTKSPDIQSAIPLIHSLKLSWPGLPYTLPLEIQRFVFGEAEVLSMSQPEPLPGSLLLCFFTLSSFFTLGCVSSLPSTEP